MGEVERQNRHINTTIGQYGKSYGHEVGAAVVHGMRRKHGDDR